MGPNWGYEEPRWGYENCSILSPLFGSAAKDKTACAPVSPSDIEIRSQQTTMWLMPVYPEMCTSWPLDTPNSHKVTVLNFESSQMADEGMFHARPTEVIPLLL